MRTFLPPTLVVTIYYNNKHNRTLARSLYSDDKKRLIDTLLNNRLVTCHQLVRRLSHDFFFSFFVINWRKKILLGTKYFLDIQMHKGFQPHFLVLKQDAKEFEKGGSSVDWNVKLISSEGKIKLEKNL